MFHQRLNELRLVLQLTPRSPLLVKAGEDATTAQLAEAGGAPPVGPGDFATLLAAAKGEIDEKKQRAADERKRRKEERIPPGADKETRTRLLREKVEPDMRFVLTRRNGSDEPYLPGSGLKGALRVRAEQWARTFLPPTERVCDIFDEKHPDAALRSCTKTVEGLKPVERYAAACRICQIFGCGGLAGRLSVSDAYLSAEAAFSLRSGVGIDRRRGAAHEGALFFYQVLDRGTFAVTLTLENFELWQAGLLAHMIHGLLAGELPVGFGTRRGLGRLQGQVQEATLTYFGLNAHQTADGGELRGLAALAAPELAAAYGLHPEPAPCAVLPGARLTAAGLRQQWQLPAAALEGLWAAAAQAWDNLCNPVQEAPA